MTHYWGPRAWKLLHCVTCQYPEHPTPKDQKHFYFFFSVIIPSIIPCPKCQHHFFDAIQNNPINDHLKSRYHLTRWLVDIHNGVNRRNGKKFFPYKKAERIYSNHSEHHQSIIQFLLYLRQRSQYGFISMRHYNQLVAFLQVVFPRFTSV